MSELRGTNVVAPILPFTTEDEFATHLALYGKGGFRSVQTIEERDNIPAPRREEGMLVYVVNDPNEINTYQLVNGEWTKSKIGSGISSVGTWQELQDLTSKCQPGDVYYVADQDQFYSFSSSREWRSFSQIYVGDIEPEDKGALWLDTSRTPQLTAAEINDLTILQKAVQELQNQVSSLKRLMNMGIIPGEIKDSYRRELIALAEPLMPEVLKDEEIEDDDKEVPTEEPDTTFEKFTTTAVCAKLGEAAEFAANKADLIDGELLFYTDRGRFAIYSQGKFYVMSSGEGSSSVGGGGGISLEDLYSLNLDYLNFSDGENNYRVRVDSSGKLMVSGFNSRETLVGSPNSTWKVYVNYLLGFNSVYCGGIRSEEQNYLGEDCLVSHNFVELANGSKEDVNLKGIYLLYTDMTPDGPYGFVWKSLELEGIIPAGGTFLIRGAQANPANSALINIDSYDIEWKDETTGKPIQFAQGASTFYLVAGTDWKNNVENHNLNNPWISENNGGPRVGYIDSCGFGNQAAPEGSSAYNVVGDWNSSLFVRRFPLDPSKQANKAYGDRKTTALWFTIDLTKHDEYLGNSTQYYWQDYRKLLMTPRASFEGKNFFSNKTDFVDNKPNFVDITFGIQATDGGILNRATRCFNWISVGYFNEFVEYRAKGSTGWTRVYSIVPNNRDNTEAINKFIEFYKRYRWKSASGKMMTTHKCIIPGFSAGEYEYRIGREGDESYYSPTYSFKVVSDSSVTNFSYIQVTDQQGFNWAEYTAWKKTADMIAKTESDFNFTINTGDATQSGNRPNEWLDYWNGREALRDKEEMFTIGNNDLCGHVSTELTDGEDATSKYSHINILRYHCFELDPRNDNYFVEWDGMTLPIYSVYSFNYGDWHFVSLNSEYAIASSKMYKDWVDSSYKGDSTFAETVNAKIEDWLKKDLQLWKNSGESIEPSDCSKAIIYMHEMPFTIVTDSFMTGTSARQGSHLNTLDSRGLYRFSRLFKKYGIRMVMGGHKHTYCLTKPIYDAPEGYVDENGIVQSGIDIMDDLGFGNSSKVTEMSRKPVIQVKNKNDLNYISDWEKYARIEVVNKITAPTYVMSQASGYKLVSNKEMPAYKGFQIPWLMAYFKQAGETSTELKENAAQHYPMYIRYDITPNDITVTVKQVHNIWNVNLDKNSSSWDMNQQLTDLSCNAMTLSTTTESDKTAYELTNIESYKIIL